MNTQLSLVKRGPKPNIATRDNLINAGMKILHETGYSATGIQDIVNAAHVPKGSFYNHFASKEAFGQEVVDYYFKSSLSALRETLTDPNIPPLERMSNYFEQRVKSFREIGFSRGCLMGNMSLEIADHSEAIRETLAINFLEWSKLFESCVAEAQKLGTVKNTIPASELAQFILNSWEGALLRMRVEKDEKPLRDYCDILFRTILA